MVLAVCRGVLRNDNDAQDAFQATFLVLFRRAETLRAAGSVGSWLYRVAYRIALEANAALGPASRTPDRGGCHGRRVRLAGGFPGRSRAMADHPLEIDRLPERYRAPIALCYLEGLTYEQAAHQLGWPLGTVGSRIARRASSCVPDWPDAG